ncbi:hypothetical protein ID853_15575 [Xenorhabdus sp. Vera]|uniref:hypothetical protein n=1 Tax=Xenorhabdus koppenhoeferi TaxID=351659 RepID=UPI0019C7D269|nr:hypothetical protein [Xenorhabdus sp. Vera]MBD2812263.1 hypothetical protein [Xenorhabdus sp. Vera]
MSVLNGFIAERKQAIHFKELLEAIAMQENQPIDVVAAFFHRYRTNVGIDEAGFDISIPAYQCYTYSRISGFDPYPDEWFQERCFDLIKAIGERYKIYDEEMSRYEFGYLVEPDEEFGLPDDYQGFFHRFYFKYDEIKSFLNLHNMELPEQFEIDESNSSVDIDSRDRIKKERELDTKSIVTEPEKPLGSRERNNLHAIVGGLSLIILMENEKRNQTYIINQLEAIFEKLEPFSESNFQRLFPLAKIALKNKGHNFDELLTKLRVTK